MIPDWNLILNILLSSIGIWIGHKSFYNKINSWLAYVLLLGLFVFGVFLFNLSLSQITHYANIQ